MAPVVKEVNTYLHKNKDDDSQNLWASILEDVQASSASKLSTARSLLVLGDNESGKSTLVAKLQGIDEPKKGTGLEYYYIDVRDEYLDEQARLDVWVLDGEQEHTGLLKYALTEKNFADTLVMLIVSMAQPWEIADSLSKWSAVLSEHVDKLRIAPDTMKVYEESLVTFFQDYTQPNVDQLAAHTLPWRDGNPLHPLSPVIGADRVVLPLADGVLSHNLGIPIVVVVTKCDTISLLEKKHEFRDEQFDYIQQYIRKFCLKYGAGLFYTSVKDECNCELLYRYLVHRIYGFSFHTPACVVERDNVFVPAGWDNERKISILYENMTTLKPDEPFHDAICKHVMRKPIHKDAEVLAEDEQLFLLKLQALLGNQAMASGGVTMEVPSPRPVRSQTPRTQERSSGIQMPTARMKTPPSFDSRLAGMQGQTTEGMLANFFNNLLSKKSGSPVAGKEPRDAAAELERLCGKINEASSSGHPGPPGS